MPEVNKTPFEIRLETLKLAKEMLDRQYDVSHQIYQDTLDAWKQAGQEFNKNSEQFLAEYVPKMYQPNEVVKLANEYYSFIVEKK